jgi:DNA (cytosine-5)-methyltransferase 1
MRLSVGSLFSGIGGFELGLERTGGFKTVWQCEKDEFCLKVLAKHWPDVKRFTDIKEMKEDIPYVDVICGGFPCQDISCAGKGAGIHAERSGLWWEMHRIISMVRPKFILLENVAALVFRGLDEVLGSLAEIGYDAEWEIVQASYFGAPHRRERIFIIAYTNSERREITQKRYSEIRLFKRISPQNPWISELPKSAICREDDGVPSRVDRLRALGNAIVPQCAEYVGRCLLDSIKEGPA